MDEGKTATGTITLLLCVVVILIAFFASFTPWMHAVGDAGQPGARLSAFQIAFKPQRLQSAFGARSQPWLILLPSFMLLLVGWWFLTEMREWRGAIVPLGQLVVVLLGVGVTLLSWRLLEAQATVASEIAAGLILTWVLLALLGLVTLGELLLRDTVRSLDRSASRLLRRAAGGRLLAVLGIVALLALTILPTFFITRHKYRGADCPEAVCPEAPCPDACPAAIAVVQVQVRGMTTRLKDYQERASKIESLVVPVMDKTREVDEFINFLEDKSIAGYSAWDLLVDLFTTIFPGQRLARVLWGLEGLGDTLHATREAAHVYATTDPLIEAIEGFEAAPTCQQLWTLANEITKLEQEWHAACYHFESVGDEIKPLKDGFDKLLAALDSCEDPSEICEEAAKLAEKLEEMSEPVSTLMDHFDVLARDSQQDLDRLMQALATIHWAAGESLVCHSQEP